MKRVVMVLGLVVFGFILSGCKKESTVKEFKQETVYTCPMHPEIRSHEPGKCPICNMDLVEAEPKEKEIKQETVYTCPMHPEIRSHEPGKCPICNMDLVEAEFGEEPADHNHGSNKKNVSLRISPYQADLIGIKPVKVIKNKMAYSIPIAGKVMSANSISFQFFQGDLKHIKKGTSFTGYIESSPENKITGKIVSIDSIVDPTSGTIRAVGNFRGSGERVFIESNFLGEMKIDLGVQMIIPEKAVLFTGKGAYVYLYEKDRLKPKKVILGSKIGEQYVVAQGLTEGDKISSGPNFLIDSEAKIRGLND